MQPLFSSTPSAPHSNGLRTATPVVSPNVPKLARCGVNLAGAEFGSEFPGTFDQTYTYPTRQNLDYHCSRGRTLIRLPFRWERIQRALFAPLDEAELERLKEVVRAVGEREILVILDVHNYGRYIFPGQNGNSYEGDIIGSARVPYAAFGDLWRRLALEFAAESAIYAYGLMNEPHDMEGNERWPKAAQTAIKAIRGVDERTSILVPGDHWTSARGWRQGDNEELLEKLNDPQENLIFEAHCYFDRDNSGTYSHSYDDEGATPNCGVEYVRPFVEWCYEKGVRGLIGEYGIPDTDTRWLVVMDRFLAFLEANGMNSTYWAGGPWWHQEKLAIEPHNWVDGEPVDRPQMLVLRQYPG